MSNQNISVYGIFKNEMEVESAVELLKSAGFSNNDVSLLLPDNHGTHTFAHEKETKAPEGATAGVGAGAILGGTFGWLVGIGSLAIPGVGPLIAAGPIVAALAGAGIGSIVGGIGGALVGLGIPEYEAKRYETFIKEGGILLSVHCEDREEVERAERLLKQCGGKDIAYSGEAPAPRLSAEERRYAQALGH